VLTEENIDPQTQFQIHSVEQRRTLLERATLVWMSLQVLVYGTRLAVVGLENSSLIAGLSVMLTATVLILAKRGISTGLFAVLLLISIGLPGMALSFFFGGLFSPVLLLLFFLPIAAFMLIGRLAGWLVTGVVCAYFLLMAVLELRGFPWPEQNLTASQVTLLMAAVLVLVMCCISAIIYHYLRLYDAFYQSIEQSNRRLQQVTAYKSQFLSNMSHEFRTPLNAIIGFSRRLERNLKDSLSERDRQSVHSILRNGEMMQLLVNDVLDMASLEAGDVAVSLESLDVALLLRQVVSDHLTAAREKNLALQARVQGAAQTHVHRVDKQKMLQILNNLISNAIKYTERGEVNVTLHDERQGFYAISVADTGCGIPDEDLPLLFHRFTRSQRVERSNITGSGLGLALIQGLVKILCGKITVQSRVGEGTTVTVYLPVEPSAV